MSISTGHSFDWSPTAGCFQTKVDVLRDLDSSCQQILGLESEMLWEALSMPTLKALDLAGD
jgi:hypothetical protein